MVDFQRRVGSGTLVDLFCGCGGFSLGAEFAGFNSIAAVDLDPTLQSGYRRNFPNSKAIQADVGSLDRSDWSQIIGRARPDVLIGGPPCQGFSRIGRRRENDPRNTMIHHFYRHVTMLRPKVFVMENVEGILDGGAAELLMSEIEGVRSVYSVLEPFVVNAAHFGAATTRRRVVVVGYDPREVDPFTQDLLRPQHPSMLTTVRDAISDLPGPQPQEGGGDTFDWADYRVALQHATPYAQRMRRPPPPGLGWREAVARNACGSVSGSTATIHEPRIVARYASIEAGRSDAVTKSPRLEWNGQCPTIRAGTGMDKGAFQAVRPLHPADPRVITVREAARLQAFPDWFTFHPTKWHSFRMIGNSVSPAVSTALLSAIATRVRGALAA
jgi:DNA (cytosine-5)-methyltransferase 1